MSSAAPALPASTCVQYVCSRARKAGSVAFGRSIVCGSVPGSTVGVGLGVGDGVGDGLGEVGAADGVTATLETAADAGAEGSADAAGLDEPQPPSTPASTVIATAGS